MRDISREELDHYINIKKLNVVHEHDLNDNSLQSVINKFVADLQENFQATISTICKTADKIGIKDQHQNSDKCLFCEVNIHIAPTVNINRVFHTETTDYLWYQFIFLTQIFPLIDYLLVMK